MPSIPQYTKGIIRERATPGLVDLSEIDRAGSGARAFASVANQGVELLQRHKQANDATAVNEAVIAKQRADMEWFEQTKKNRTDNPFGFAKDVEPELRKRDDEWINGLPSAAAKKAARQTFADINLRTYGQALSWENHRAAEVYASRIQKSEEDLKVLAARAGREGGDLESLLRNADATTASAATVFSADKLETINRGIRGSVVTDYLQSLIEENPKRAKDILDTKKHDDDLGADTIQALYKTISAEEKRRQSEYIAKQGNALNSEYRNMIDVQNHGVYFSREKAEEMAQRARDLDNPAMAEDILLRADTQDIVADFVSEPLSVQSNTLASMSQSLAGDQSKENFFKVKSVQEAFKAKQDAITSGRAFEYYQQAGVISPMSPLRTNDPQAFINDFAMRKAAQRQIYNKDGIVVPPLSKADITAMTKQYNEMPAKNRMQYLSTFAEVFDSTDAAAVAQVMAQDEPALAGIMAIIKENPKRAEDAILGAQRDKLVPRKDIVEEMNSLYGDAVGDPQTMGAIIDIVHNAYTEEAFRSGEQVLNSDTLKDVAESVVGRKIDYGRTSVLPFRKPNNQFISAGEFKRLTKNTNIDLLKSSLGRAPHMRGQEVSNELLQDMFKEWSLVTTGDGIYELRNPWDHNQVLVDGEGLPFEFNFKALVSDVDTRSMINKGANALFEKASDATAILPEDE